MEGDVSLQKQWECQRTRHGSIQRCGHNGARRYAGWAATIVGIELNPDYATMARRRIKDDAPLFVEDQVSLRRISPEIDAEIDSFVKLRSVTQLQPQSSTRQSDAMRLKEWATSTVDARRAHQEGIANVPASTSVGVHEAPAQCVESK
jgi:hypothetical protein